MDQSLKNIVKRLKKRVGDKWDETRSKKIFGGDRIIRGHMRSISTDIEDSIAIFIYEYLGKDYKIFVDPTISIEDEETGKKKSNRPDILILKNDIVLALIELKSNMGFCRNLKKEKDDGVIKKIKKMNKKFSNMTNLKCKFSKYNFDDGEKNDPIDIKYGKDVKLFLIALTTDNGLNKDLIIENKGYARDNGIIHYLLFDGWYDGLIERVEDIKEFVNELDLLKKKAF